MEESKYAQLEPKQLKELNLLEEKLEVTLIAYKTSKVNDFTNQKLCVKLFMSCRIILNFRLQDFYL